MVRDYASIVVRLVDVDTRKALRYKTFINGTKRYIPALCIRVGRIVGVHPEALHVPVVGGDASR
jgi:hypothetical protein